MPGASIDLIHIGVLGAGRWGRNLISDLVAAGAQVTSVDPCAKARMLAEKAGAKISLQHLHQTGKLRGLVVATPTHLHFDSVRQALEYKVPVFCEKPLTTRLSQAEELIRLAGDRLFALEKWRYHPAVECLAQLAKNGQLGTIRSIRTWRLSRGTPQNDVDPVWTLAPHDLSIVRHIAGFIPPLRAVYPEWDGECMVGVKAVFDDIFRVTIEVSAQREEYRRCVEINGTHGTARFELDLPTRIELIAPSRS